jgi:hypothetical protein
MLITVTCTCGKQYQVANEHAGKSFTCKACKTTGTVPVGSEQGTTPNERHSRSSSLNSPSTNDHNNEKAEAPAAAPEHDTKPCPSCAETIKAAARKCRFCGEILDGSPPLTKPSTGFSGPSSKGVQGLLPPELPGNRDAVERNGVLLTFHTSYEVAYKTVLTAIEQTRLAGNTGTTITHNSPREGLIAATADSTKLKNKVLLWAIFYTEKGLTKCRIAMTGMYLTGDLASQNTRLLDRIVAQGEELPVFRGAQGVLPPRIHEHPGIDLAPLSGKISFAAALSLALFAVNLFIPLIGWPLWLFVIVASFRTVAKVESEIADIPIPVNGIEALGQAKVWCYASSGAFVLSIVLYIVILDALVSLAS